MILVGAHGTFTLGKLIAKGGFGHVFKAKVNMYDNQELLKVGDTVAVKISLPKDDEETQIMHLYKEDTMKNLKDPYVKVYDVFTQLLNNISGEYEICNVAIMQRLGVSFHTLSKTHNYSKFSIDCAL